MKARRIADAEWILVKHMEKSNEEFKPHDMYDPKTGKKEKKPRLRKRP